MLFRRAGLDQPAKTAKNSAGRAAAVNHYIRKRGLKDV